MGRPASSAGPPVHVDRRPAGAVLRRSPGDGIVMPTGYFEAERLPTETQPEEVQDFDFLIAEIRDCSRADAQSRMASWLERLQEGWKNDSEQWSGLIDLLPRPADVEPSVASFRKLLLSTTREPTAADL